jgi:3-hydroxyisobutyrate dehydrogenase
VTAIAFLGTGAMGAPMARNIAAAGHDVRVWNRTRARAEGLGAYVCDTAAEAIAGSDLVVTMLSDGPVTAETLDGALASGQLLVQMGTVGIDWTARLEELVHTAGAELFDAPVIGSSPAAESGELIVFAGGSDAALERARPVFEAVAKQTIHVGGVGSASRLKLVFNYWGLGLAALLGEVVALADGLGPGGAQFLDAIRGGFTDSVYVQLKAGKMVARDWAPLFKLALGRKDLGLILEAASGAELDLPVARAVADEYDAAIARGYGDSDTAAVIEAIRPGSA